MTRLIRKDRRLRILVSPYNRETGYQQPLYREIVAKGVDVRYLATGTPSQTINLFLIPLSLAWHRMRGFEIWHIHWTYNFSTIWSSHLPFGLRAMQFWFGTCLATARILNYEIVWTAHNILPHERVFYDDVSARHRLTHAANAVIAHQEVAIPKLEELGARNIRLIAAGPYTGEYKTGITRDEARQQLGIESDDRVVVFVGNIVPYKQVDWLLRAASTLDESSASLRVVVAGDCSDGDMRDELTRLATEAGTRVIMNLGFVPNDQLQVYFASADIAALPFARITSSGSAILAMSFGVPLLLPDLPELTYFPDSVAIRYEPTFEALVDALARVSRADTNELSVLSDGAHRYVASLSWEQSAQSTVELYRELLKRR